MSRILIVDDEPTICWSFEQIMHDLGHEVASAASAESAWNLLEEFAPHVILLDFRLPGMDGLSALRKLRAEIGNIPVILMTAFGSLDLAVNALEEGAFDYLPKPFDLDVAIGIVNRAISDVSVEQISKNTLIRPDETLVGTSRAMQEIFRQIAIVAPQNTPIFLSGERGVGKETVARAIHRHSGNDADRFVAVSLPTTNEATIERELFGEDNKQSGDLSRARGGTLYFKKITELPLMQQAKLLRILDEQREGAMLRGARNPADFRLIVADDQSLEQLLNNGLLLENLYYRLKAFSIHIPPLRERTEDIPILANQFLAQIVNCGTIALDSEALEFLCRQPWHGNVRELLSAIQHAVLICRGNRITVDCLPSGRRSSEMPEFLSNDVARFLELLRIWADSRILTVDPQNPATSLYEQFLSTFEPTILTAALDAANGNRKSAADLLGLHRETLRKRLKRYEMDDELPW